MQEGFEKFDIVSVVFQKEIPLLRLQAISIREFFPAKNLGKILIVVNDIDENGCIDALKKMLPEYGDFETRVEIIRPDEIIGTAHSIRDKARRWRVEHPILFSAKKRRGWKGNSGWRCQQAFKLLAASRARSNYVLILDAKNWFTRVVNSADLVGDYGKPLTYRFEPDSKQSAWVRASFSALGGIYDGGPVSPSTTPCIYKRTFLVEAVDYLERALGPLDYFFARNRSGATEFMLLWAFSELKCGGWRNVFSEGLAPCLATFRSSNEDLIENRLNQLGNDDYFCAAIHRDSFQVFSDDQSQRLTESWVKKGFFPDAKEAKLALNEMSSAKDQRHK